MNFEKKLFERFKFFHPKKPLTESLMGFGIETGPGWHDLIWKLCEAIEATNPDDDFEVLQVKEKFGGLRFYTNWETDEIAELIQEAELKSEETCEVCGKKGEITNKHGWLKCLCEKCDKEIEND